MARSPRTSGRPRPVVAKGTPKTKADIIAPIATDAELTKKQATTAYEPLLAAIYTGAKSDILVTDGGFRPNGSFRQLPRFNSRHLERLFQAEVLRMLVNKGLIGEETVRNLLAWRHSGFSVHGAVRV